MGLKKSVKDLGRKKWLQTSLKIAGSCLALFLLFRTSDGLWDTIKTSLYSLGWERFMLALFIFQISVFISTLRLQVLLHDRDVKLSFRENLNLYYLGMFLNLFVPGGVGGDVYKGYHMAKRTESRKRTIYAILLSDRLIGLTALVVLVGIFFQYTQSSFPEPYDVLLTYGSIVGLILVLPISYLIINKLSKNSIRSYTQSLVLGFAVQLLQVFTVLVALQMMAPSSIWLAYFTLFLISSIVTIIPITVGGIGLRELSFAWPPLEDFFGIDNEVGITISLFFFVIGAITSLTGIIPFLRRNRIRK